MKFLALLIFCTVLLFGCSESNEANTRQIFFGMWSDPAHTELSVGMVIGKGKEVGHFGVFADEEYGPIDLYFDGMKVGTHDRGGVVMTTTGGVVELKGNASRDLVLIGVEKLGSELVKITEIEEIESGPIELTIDHRNK
ncbi:hypothetical protein DDZ13_14210 [Coraliomargarita sinensis]|uniref:Uncharacterized protein n=1 Tax=Coraliomargarita sinensis TaxID=2174842 RepID=A0A317ZD39_9BACT|nr:hypothetical protein [Coraliomargarita sinensis]PXA03066.1 hypothetical protein DDZ13_14210 [Coraliomargarita sinensis]